MADFTADTAQQTIEEKRHQDRYRGEAQWTQALSRQPWDHIWRLRFPPRLSTNQAAQELHNFLTGVLNAGNLGDVGGSLKWAFAVERVDRNDGGTARPCARGLTAGTRLLSLQDMRDCWEYGDYGQSRVEEIQNKRDAASFMAGHLSRPDARPVFHLPK